MNPKPPEETSPLDQLPLGVALSWGLDVRPTKGPARGLTLDAITTAAVELADEEGLAGLSMSRIATRLGFSTMSLYRYVSSKEELISLLLDAAAGRPWPLETAGQGWRAELTEWSRRQLSFWFLHPWTLQIPMAGPPLGPNNLAWAEQAIQTLRDTGLQPHERLGILGLISSYGMNEARLILEATESTLSYGKQLLLVIDEESFPALHEVATSGMIDGPPLGAVETQEDIDYFTSFGLERILDGIQVLIERRAAAGA